MNILILILCLGTGSVGFFMHALMQFIKEVSHKRTPAAFRDEMDSTITKFMLVIAFFILMYIATCIGTVWYTDCKVENLEQKNKALEYTIDQYRHHTNIDGFAD